jgi:ABC-type lipoprotein release transport system permease subunit
VASLLPSWTQNPSDRKFSGVILFQVDSLDPIVRVGATASILMLALVASVIPAYRAAAVYPMEALRTE